MIVHKMLWKYISLWALKKKNSKEISFSLDELLQYILVSFAGSLTLQQNCSNCQFHRCHTIVWLGGKTISYCWELKNV